jgi:hypothetical protein
MTKKRKHLKYNNLSILQKQERDALKIGANLRQTAWFAGRKFHICLRISKLAM